MDDYPLWGDYPTPARFPAELLKPQGVLDLRLRPIEEQRRGYVFDLANRQIPVAGTVIFPEDPKLCPLVMRGGFSDGGGVFKLIGHGATLIRPRILGYTPPGTPHAHVAANAITSRGTVSNPLRELRVVDPYFGPGWPGNMFVLHNSDTLIERPRGYSPWGGGIIIRYNSYTEILDGEILDTDEDCIAHMATEPHAMRDEQHPGRGLRIVGGRYRRKVPTNGRLGVTLRVSGITGVRMPEEVLFEGGAKQCIFVKTGGPGNDHLAWRSRRRFVPHDIQINARIGTAPDHLPEGPGLHVTDDGTGKFPYNVYGTIAGQTRRGHSLKRIAGGSDVRVAVVK